MFSTLRKFPVIFLMMLQFIAPLVHAHASEQSPNGLHVPGLERYSAVPDTRKAQMKTLQYNVSEDMIVVVDTGLKQTQANLQADSDNNNYLHQQTVVFNFPVSRFDVNFSPQPEPPISRLFISSPPPRAPPTE